MTESEERSSVHRSTCGCRTSARSDEYHDHLSRSLGALAIVLGPFCSRDRIATRRMKCGHRAAATSSQDRTSLTVLIAFCSPDMYTATIRHIHSTLSLLFRSALQSHPCPDRAAASVPRTPAARAAMRMHKRTFSRVTCIGGEGRERRRRHTDHPSPNPRRRAAARTRPEVRAQQQQRGAQKEAFRL